MEIKAIETIYNGYRFRSRLEARWAVFFDTLGIEYQYEPEGFDLGEAGWYLPDFWMPYMQIWIEIKGRKPSESEWAKMSALSDQANRVVVVFEDVEPEANGLAFLPTSMRNPLKSLEPMRFFRCVACQRLKLGPTTLRHSCACWNRIANYYFKTYGKTSEDSETKIFERIGQLRTQESEDITHAFLAARQARFEHGETPDAQH